MSKGYYAIKPVVFHNKQDKDNFLNENLEYIHIDKKSLRNLMRLYETRDIVCKSCNEIHTHGKIQWSKLNGE